MTRYLDVGVVRIQSWLTRTPSLRGRRGASTMISEATDAETIRRLLSPMAGLVEINPEVGQVDGVVSLRLRTGSADTASIGRTVVHHLRAALPSAALKITVWQGSDYVTARDAAEPASEHEWLPAVAEWPPGKPCDWCRHWPASAIATVRSETADEEDTEQALCADCLLRNKKAGFATSASRVPGPERSLVRRAGNARQGIRPEAPDTFEQLAKLGLGTDGDDTHLATVHADGNAIGRFISQLRQRKSAKRVNVAKAIDEATWRSLVDAVEVLVLEENQPMLPVIAHLVGGDDVLVSVPAHGGWEFVTTLLSGFTAHLAEQLDGVDLPLPTLSAGMVIHHRSTPFSVVADLAATLLKSAKSAHRGEAAVLWQDLTHDGPHRDIRPSMTHADLLDVWQPLAELAAVAPAQRQQLALLSRPTNGTRTSDEQLQRIRGQSTRLGLTQITEPFLQRNAPDLADAVAMVRWWRSA